METCPGQPDEAPSLLYGRDHCEGRGQPCRPHRTHPFALRCGPQNGRRNGAGEGTRGRVEQRDTSRPGRLLVRCATSTATRRSILARKALAVEPRFIWSHIALAADCCFRASPAEAEKTPDRRAAIWQLPHHRIRARRERARPAVTIAKRWRDSSEIYISRRLCRDIARRPCSAGGEDFYRPGRR